MAQLLGGVTTIGDTGSLNRPGSLVTAARGLGIRLRATTWASDAVCPPGGEVFVRTRDADTVLCRIEDLLGARAGDATGRLRCRPSIAYVTNMTDELGRGFAELVSRHGAGFATHAGAVRNEPDTICRCYGATEVRRLDSFGLVNEGTMAAHCSFVDEEEQELLLSRGVHICQSSAKYGPSGESSLTGTGVVPRLRRARLDVSVSTDGTACPQAGMVEAMRTV